jgi:gamma-glutamyltranspeptidase/glutathione hydrolase
MRDFAFPGRSPAFATNGMAATSVPAATLAALDVLRAGGNALDAAVAAVAVLCVAEPQSTGIGGDCFCLYARPGKPVVAMNGSGRAPAGATVDWFESQGVGAITAQSPHAVTVPGAVSAWETLLAAHGTKGLDELLRPAIGYAEHGHVVTPRVGSDWEASVDKLAAGGARHFLPHPKVGDVFKQGALAETLKAIARHGSRAFYEGPVAANMVATLRARGGVHTEADFAAGRTAAMFVDPIHTGFRGHEVWQCPPNGSGVIVLMLLGMLRGWDPAPDGPLGVVRLHRHIEAARLAYRDRDAFLADPSQVDVPVEMLTSDAYLNALRALIRDDVAMPVLPLPGETELPATKHKDTVYLCVVDRDGNACSFINSLFESFGSGIYAANSGVFLQNRGFSFNLDRGHPNCIAPNKRPMHTIIPGMVTKGEKIVMPYGVMGGHFQPMGQTLFLSNHFDYGLDIQESIDLARIFPRLGRVQAERSIPLEVIDRLSRMGHGVDIIDKPHGGGQAIYIDHDRGVLVGGSDPRKDGLALGY